MKARTVAFLLLNLGAGGVERVIATLLPEFSKQGLCCVVICLNSSESFYPIPDGCKVFSLRSIFTGNNPARPSWMFPILAPFILNKLLSEHEVVCVQSFLPLPNLVNIIASMLTRIKRKVSLSERSSPKELIRTSRWHLKTVYYLVIRFLYKRADTIIAISSGIKSDLIELGVKEEKIKVVYNPNSPAADNTARSDEEKRLASYKYFLCVGRHEHCKGIDIAIKSFRMLISNNRELADFKLVIVGRGTCSRELFLLAHRLGLDGQVIFIEKSTSIHALMAQAEMFWFPSRFEGFGNVLVEAMSSGALICSTNCCHGPKEILTAYGEWLATPGSISSFYSKCYSLLQLKQSEKESLIRESRSSLGRFNIALIAYAYIECILQSDS